MATSKHFVIDTNVHISFLLFPQSVPGQAVTKALKTGVLLRSENTLSELARILERPKFDRYLTRYERMVFLDRFIQDTVHVNVQPAIRASRDVKDNKFLELAVAGQATCIITGDSDLLDLHPFRGISIVTPAQYSGATRHLNNTVVLLTGQTFYQKTWSVPYLRYGP
jgi:putative PIN family toxin of toxin-antitoxin system